MRKTDAFTLTEAAVALAIAAVVVPLAMGVLLLLQRNMSIIGGNYSKKNQLELLEQRLATDLQRYHDRKQDPFLEETVLSNMLDSVTYRFGDSLLLRETDTLFVGGIETEFYLSGKRIEKGAFDALKLNFHGMEMDTVSVFLWSPPDARTKMEQFGDQVR